VSTDKLFKINGFDQAIIGVQECIEPKLVYDIDKIADILMQRDGMTSEDAYDYISYNFSFGLERDGYPILVSRAKIKDLI
tara:strand:- start:27 stop:266 length:240 start_codon:yes stop_codon:yes gene_type:complete